MRRSRGSLLWILALLASIPALLIAYLGQYSRLMGDDWCFFGTALHLGGRDYFSFWLSNWHSSLTYVALHDILAPLGPEAMPAVIPAIVFGLWLFGLAWLYSLMLRGLRLDTDHRPIALLMALLSLAAFVTGVYDWEPLYWYAASMRHSLPVGVFLIYLALAWEAASRRHSASRLAVYALAGATACFVNGGLSELQTALQLIILTLLLLGIRAYVDSRRRRPYLTLFAAGWIGNAMGLTLQLLLPGSATRMSDMGTVARYSQVRSLPELLVETVETSARLIGHQGNIAGFTLLFALGLVLILLLHKSKQATADATRASTGAAPLPAGNGARNLSAALLLGAMVALGLTQMPGLPVLQSASLYVGGLILLGVLACQLAAARPDFRSRRVVLSALFGSAFALSSLALSIASGHFLIGIVYERTLTFSALLSVLSGLVWGACIGLLIQRSRTPTQGEPDWTRGLIGLGFAVIALLFLNIALTQVRLIPDFATYAGEWDARHRRIVQLRDSGESDVTVTPYSYHITQAISPVDLEIVGWSCQPYFYGIDSITMSQNAHQ